jgi:hypothetical protein
MKKGIQQNNPALTFWQSILLDGRIHKLAIDCRVKISIPEGGFNFQEEFDIWAKKIDNKKDNTLVEYNTKLFVDKLKEIAHYDGIISETSFKILMIRFLYYNNIEDNYFSLFSGQGMNINIIKNGNILYNYGEEFLGEIKDGIYIKINPFSTISNIVKFIDFNRNLIREKQKFYIKKEKLKKPKKIKFSSNFERNKLIIDLNDSFSNKQLEKSFGIKREYKDITISVLMKIAGYQGVTPSIVKAVKQRRKIK